MNVSVNKYIVLRSSLWSYLHKYFRQRAPLLIQRYTPDLPRLSANIFILSVSALSYFTCGFWFSFWLKTKRKTEITPSIRLGAQIGRASCRERGCSKLEA